MNTPARCLITALALLAASLGSASAQGKKPSHFDIRNDTSEASVATVESLRASGASKARGAAGVQSAMAEGKAQLATAVPGLRVELNPVTKTPEAVDAAMGAETLTPPSANKPEAIVRGFLAKNAALFGLSKGQTGELKTLINSTDPGGNLSWVEVEQTLNGIPVFQGRLRAAVRADGAILRTTSNLAAGLEATSLPTAPKLSAPEAAVAAAASVEIAVDAASMQPTSVSEDGRTQTLAKGPFRRETKVNLTYFPVEPGVATLAYSMVLWEKKVAWYVLVDAQSGQLLWRKNITNDAQAATYSVYDSDSPNPISPTNATPGSGIQGAPVARTTFTLISEMPAPFTLTRPWIEDTAGGVNAVTTGNNVDAGLDLSSPDGVDANGRAIGNGRVFNFNYTPGGQAGEQDPTLAAYQSGVVTNLFFWTNRYHDRMYTYGFREQDGNFQTNNFGLGGQGNDAVSAEAQDSSGTDNANFSTPPDGESGYMQMYVFTGPDPDRDGDLDQEIVIHELTHGLSNRLHLNGSGLVTVQSGGMGEGWSDFYARALLSTAAEDVNGVYASGAYATLDFFGLGTDNSYYGIRRFPYAVKTAIGPNGKPHNPMTFADIDPARIATNDGAYSKSFIFDNTAQEVHAIGEIWCMALLEVRARMITRLGFTAGNDLVLQLVTAGMKGDVGSPTLLQARNSIITAANAEPDLAKRAANVADIWAGFAARGMGFNASVTSTTQQLSTVVESFITPNLILVTNPIVLTGADPLTNNLNFTDVGGNNDGFADPGEPIVVDVPIRNLLTTTATGVTVSLDGGAPVSYPNIALNTTQTQQFSYTVPPATPSGTRLRLTVAINSSLGPVGPVPFTFDLVTGHPVNGLAENFDALPGTALPAGWTTTKTGVGVNWVASATNSDSQAKNAFTPDVSTTGSASMTTPSVPITSASPQLVFRTAYNLELGSTFWDGMVLEMSVNGGAFQDIIEAGGEFLSGGYNATLAFSGNPLSGRNGWGGLSAGTSATPGYITTRVLLPPSLNGKSVRFKWIVGCDGSVVASGAAGARIDGVLVGSGTAIGQSQNEPPEILPQTFGVVKNKPNGFIIGTVAASDPNAGQTLTYSIEGDGNTGGAFALNSTTGQLTVATSSAVTLANSPFSLIVKVTDNGTVGGPKSAQATVTVNVREPGATPNITGQQPIATLEDNSRTIVLADLVIDDPDSPPANFTLTVQDGANYTHIGNSVTPAVNFNGSLAVGMTVSDGDTDSAPFSATVDVTPVNDAPSFTQGPDQPIIADGLPHTVPMWATNISTGPTMDETTGQMPSFTVTTSDDAFFNALPAVSGSGELTFTAKPILGSVTVTVVMHDDGGTANSGVDVSAGQSFVITSTAVENDPPSFIVGSDQAVAQDAGPQTVPNFVTAVSPGPPDEAGQLLTFTVIADNPGLFDAQPVIIRTGTTGTLTFTPNPTANGSTTVRVTLTDHPAGGGDITTAEQTFLIAVTAFAGHDGVYNGLALPAPATPLSAEKTGLIRLDLSASRSFTGKFKLGVFSFGLKGTVDNAGVLHFATKTGPVTSLTLDRKGQPPLFLKLSVDVIGDSDQISGTIHTEDDPDHPWAVVVADRAKIYSAVPPAFAGTFTVIFEKPVAAPLPPRSPRPPRSRPPQFRKGKDLARSRSMPRAPSKSPPRLPMGPRR